MKEKDRPVYPDNLDAGNTTPIFTLSVISKLSGIPAHSIRQYIDRGLIIPFKLDTNRHLFSQGDIGRLRHINYLIQERGLNIAGIRAMLAMVPCWRIRLCPSGERSECDAYNSGVYPCWEASEKGRRCRNEDCRECEVYSCLSRSPNIKSVLKPLF